MKCIYILLAITISLVAIYYDLYRYIHINLFPVFDISSYKQIPRVNKRPKVIISFTTTPERIGKSRYMLSSILSQTVRVDEIRIYIPLNTRNGESYIIPSWMKKLHKNLPCFKIKRPDKDWGPATKLIPAVIEENNKDTYIIYIDDDMIYHSKMIEILISYSNRYPMCAISHSGHSISGGRPFSYFDPYYSRPVDIVEGFGGVIVHPKFFDIEILKDTDKYPKNMFYVDDVYLSGMLNRNSRKRLCTQQQKSLPHFKEFMTGYLMRVSDSLSSTFNKTSDNFNIGLSCFDWK